VLNLIYFSGMLIKGGISGQTHEAELDRLLVGVLVIIILAFATAVVLEVNHIRHAIRRSRRIGSLLHELPVEDPADGTGAFYAIQIPVEESNMGAAFYAKQPHELVGIPAKKKLEIVRLLSAENSRRLDTFFEKLRR
jgi:hypothetical protein